MGNPKYERTAREWLVVLVAGLLIALAFGGAGNNGAVGFGMVIAFIGGVGLSWRLLKSR